MKVIKNMVNQLTTLSIFFLSTSLTMSYAIDHKPDSFTITQSEKSKQLNKIAHDYLIFINDVGRPQSVADEDPRIDKLFATNLTKIDNTLALFENDRSSLLTQMRGFEKKYDPSSNQPDWSVDIEKALIIPSEETNSVVVYFQWSHINVGKATTMAILQCNHHNQIEKIIDVWNTIKK